MPHVYDSQNGYDYRYARTESRLPSTSARRHSYDDPRLMVAPHYQRPADQRYSSSRLYLSHPPEHSMYYNDAQHHRAGRSKRSPPRSYPTPSNHYLPPRPRRQPTTDIYRQQTDGPEYNTLSIEEEQSDDDDDDDLPTEMEILAAKNAKINAMKSYSQEPSPDPVDLTQLNHALASLDLTPPQHDTAPLYPQTQPSTTSQGPADPSLVTAMDDASTVLSESASHRRTNRRHRWLPNWLLRRSSSASVPSSSRSSSTDSSETLVGQENKKEPLVVLYPPATAKPIVSNLDRVQAMDAIWVFKQPSDASVWVAFDYDNQLAMRDFANNLRLRTVSDDGLDITDSHVGQGKLPVLIAFNKLKAFYPTDNNNIDSMPIKCIPNAGQVTFVRR
ncbi:hypothetical protein DM01DRAFT_1405033 [Hesseltinella vesiculosa]|uniref:Uncharacterized protein n=1 Tax=Hesseltinella vesiculosa TaxID=101127 RepID=A0A1X2GQX3_9FUNG|nr:hypothetical protein DM01DRAFT_1405033 [Hesseltinella vesiculosa]